MINYGPNDPIRRGALGRALRSLKTLELLLRELKTGDLEDPSTWEAAWGALVRIQAEMQAAQPPKAPLNAETPEGQEPLT